MALTQIPPVMIDGELGLDWQSSVETSSFTAVNGNGYFVNTTSGSITVTIPSSPTIGDSIGIIDYAGTAASNTIILTSSNNIQGSSDDKIVNYTRGALRITYADTTQGWVASAAANEGTSAINPLPPTIIPSANAVGAMDTITFANNHIYSTYNGTASIIKYNIDGSQDSSFGVSYSNMTSIADNRAGTVFYARMSNNRVRYFNYSGTYLGGLFNDTSGNDHTFFDGTTLWTGGSGSLVYGRNIGAATDSTFSLFTYTFNEGCYVNSTQKIWMVDGNALREYTPVFTGTTITSFQASSPAVTVAGWGSAVKSITYDYTNDLVYTLEQSSSNSNWYLVQRPPTLT